MATTAVAQRSGDVSVGCACTGVTSSLRCGHSGAPLARRPTRTDDSHQDQGRETYPAPRRQEPPLPAVTTGTQYFTLDDERVPVTWLRPSGLVEPRGCQERVQRHTMEQFGELAPMVQIPDALVPEMVDKLEDVLEVVDLFVPVQEIEVPKISSLSCPRPRLVLPVPQSPEQLVEVPTVLTALFIREQIRAKRRVQGFPPSRVQQRRLLLWNAFLSRLWSRSLTFLLVVALGRVRPHLLVLQMRILLGFSQFSSWKKVRIAGQVVSPQLGEHVSPSTVSAH